MRGSRMRASVWLLVLACLWTGVARAQHNARRFTVTSATLLPADALGQLVVSAGDGGLATVVNGATTLSETYPILRRLDASGSQLWDLPLAARVCTDGQLKIWKVVHTPGLGFTVLGDVSRGTSVSQGGVHDLWIARVDEQGHLVWQKLIGSPHGNEVALGPMRVTADGLVSVAYQQSVDPSMMTQASSFVTTLEADGMHRWTTRLVDVETWSSSLSYDDAGDLWLAAPKRSEGNERTLTVFCFDEHGAIITAHTTRTGQTWSSARIVRMYGGALEVALRGGKHELVVTLSIASGRSKVARAPHALRDTEHVTGSDRMLFVPTSRKHDEPLALLEATRAGVTKHRFVLPTEIPQFTCPVEGECDRRLSFSFVRAHGDGFLDLLVGAQSKTWLVTLQPAPPAWGELSRQEQDDALRALSPRCAHYDDGGSGEPHSVDRFTLDARTTLLLLRCSTFGYNAVSSAWTVTDDATPQPARFEALPTTLMDDSPARPEMNGEETWLMSAWHEGGALTTGYCYRGLCDGGSGLKFTWTGEAFRLARIYARIDGEYNSLEELGPWPIIWPDSARCDFRWRNSSAGIVLASITPHGERTTPVADLHTSCTIEDEGVTLACEDGQVVVSADGDYWLVWKLSPEVDSPADPLGLARIPRGCNL